MYIFKAEGLKKLSSPANLCCDHHSPPYHLFQMEIWESAHITLQIHRIKTHLQAQIKSFLLSTWFTALLRMWNTCFYYCDTVLFDVFLKVNQENRDYKFMLHAAQQVLWPAVQNRHQQMHPLRCRPPTQLMLQDQLAIIQSSQIHQRINAAILREVNISSNWEWQMHWVVLQTTPIKLSGMVSFSLPLLRIYYCNKMRPCSVFLEYFWKLVLFCMKWFFMEYTAHINSRQIR